MKEVYVVGEDPVTKEIVSRIIRDYAPNLYIKGYLPARGGEIKKKMENFNAFSLSYPVVLLSDMDADDCAPMVLKTEDIHPPKTGISVHFSGSLV